MAEADRLECHRELMQFQASDFQAWRHHPVTRLVFKLLRDLQGDIYREAFQAFLAGGLETLQGAEYRGRYRLADELLDLEWAGLCQWYGYQPKPKEGDREAG